MRLLRVLGIALLAFSVCLVFTLVMAGIEVGLLWAGVAAHWRMILVPSLASFIAALVWAAISYSGEGDGD